MSFRICSWKYVNEGNVHVVLQILDSDYVVRLIKKDNCGTKETNICDSVDFVNLVMIPLIYSEKKYKEEIVEIGLEEMVELSKALTKFRPKSRMIKTMFSTTAIKAPNLTIVTVGAENYCIEIKPKEGYFANNLKKYLKCYYCLKQYLKLIENHIQQISNYCPLDLFSGHRDKMKFALKSLIEIPQNNFKIFKNGGLIYGENLQKNCIQSVIKDLEIFGDSINLFLDFLVEILLSDGESDVVVFETDVITPKSKGLQCMDCSNLEKHSFLYKLLKLQRLSEKFNYNADLYDIDFDYVKSILNKIKTQKLDLTTVDHQDIVLSWNPFYLALISAVVKDCSIMLSFTKSINNQFPKVSIGGHELSYKLGVTDLEPKSAKVLQKRSETEQKLFEIYAKIARTS